MKSRTLPKDFDTKQTLHSALGRPLGYASVPPSVYSPTSIDDEDARSYGFEYDSEDNHTESPSITRPTFTDQHMAPSSFSVSEVAPPLISGSATAPFANSRLSNPFSRTESFPAISQAQSDSPHLQRVTQASRRRAESVVSSAGFDLSASEIINARESPPTSETNKTTYLAQHHHAFMDESDVGGLPDNVYFSNGQNIFAPEMHLNMSSQGQWHNFPDAAPMHSSLNPTQHPDLSLAPQHGSLAIRSNLQQPPTHQESRNLPLLPPQGFDMLQSGPLYQNLSFNASSFVDHRSQLPQPYNANSAYTTPVDTRPGSSYHSSLAPTSST